MDEISDNPLRQGLRLRRMPSPCALIILGATGDLTQRKLLPALFSLFRQDLLPLDCQIIGFARREKSSEQFRAEVSERLGSNEQAARFTQQLHYHCGDFTDSGSYESLVKFLSSMASAGEAHKNRLFYLATPPSRYPAIVDLVGGAGLAAEQTGWTRIIIEKPFGRDLSSAVDLNRKITSVFDERQIYRIDHYLGKETVQNILVFRFANGIFEPIWNRRYVDHVQITVAETIGVEGRGRFFEETGITRDIVQNHMLQLLCLVAMEPPSTFAAEAVRDEKVKVLQAVSPFKSSALEQNVVRAQYRAGSLWGESRIGYLEEEGVAPDSTVETYTALQLHLNNWRWAGVPFFLRTGKRLPKRVTEIAIFFKDAPLQLFGPDAEGEVAANVLVLNIQPDEGISLRFDSKVPGPGGRIRPVTMDFRYGSSFGEPAPDAYERLLLDALIGDSTLFTRADESESAWKILDPVLSRWQQQRDVRLPGYATGSWGPAEADQLIGRMGRTWRRL